MYLDLARELKKQWNMNVVVISIEVGVLVFKKKPEDLEIRRRTETI